jgi:hypothetical protein
MIELLITVLIGLLIIGLLWWVVTMLPLPQPFAQIAQVVIVVLAVIWLIYVLMGVAGMGPGLSLRR